MRTTVTVSTKGLFFAGCVVVIVGFVLGTRADEIGQVVGPVFGFKKSANTLDLSSLESTYQYLEANYDGKLSTQALIDGANHGLVAAAGDKFTVYLTPKEADALNSDLTGEIGGGIGAQITDRKGQPTITMLLPGNPAVQSGLKVGDVITAINGESTKNWTADKTVGLIRGKVGTSVKITISRDNQSYSYSLTRAEVNNPSVQSSVKNGIGTLTITRFDEQTGALAEKAAEQFKQQNVKGVVLDLRDDGGGYIDAAVDVASLWLNNNKLIVSQRTDGKTTDKRYSSGPAPLRGVKTVILVNGNTASASEILSSALKDNGAATLLGEKTYGKGSVQEVINLGGGSELKVTVAHWYTPKGINVGGKGITPDKIVNLTAKDAGDGNDTQLNAALKELQ